MPEGFKLLDAYVEVTASGKGLAEKVGKDFTDEAPAAAKKSSASFGSSLLDGFKALPSVGGSVAAKVGDDFEKAAPESARRSSSSFGSSLLSGMGGLRSIGGSAAGFFGSAFTGIIGGLVGGVTSTVMGAIGNTVGAIGNMLTSVSSLVASTVIDFNSTLQNATIGFTTMLGSGEKSAAFLNQLQDFAKTTPFEFKNLIANAQNMMGMGIAAKDVIPDLTALGDSVASIGGSASQVDSVTLAFDQMSAKGTLDMGNMNQIMQNGVPSALKIMAAAYHVTTGQMIENISTGKVQADVALPALVKGIEKGTKATAALGGMMDKQSTTFTGALSNIQDGLTQTVSKAFKPFFDVASEGMQSFATALSGKPAERFQKDVTKALQPLAKDIGKWFKGIDFNKIFSDAGSDVKEFGKFLKSKDFADFVGQMKDIATSVKQASPVILKAIKDLGPGFLGVIKWMVDTTSAFADGASQWVGIFKAIGKWFKDTVAAFQDGFNQIAKFVTDTVAAFQDGWNQIATAFKNVTGWMKGLKGDIRGWGKDAGTWLLQAGRDIVAGLIKGLEQTASGVGTVIGGIANTVKDVFTGPSGIDSHSPSKVFEKYGTWIIQGLQKGLLGSVDQIKQASTDLSDAVKSAFSTTNMTSTQEDAALKHIKKVTADLVYDANVRTKAVAALAAAKDTLAGLKSDKASYGADLRTSVIGAGAIGSLYGAATTTSSSAMAGTLDGASYTGSYTSTSTSGGGLSGVKAGLKTLLANTKAFTANLKKLVTMGLDKTTLQQLLDAGPTDGLPITADLLADPAGMKQIVSLQKQLYTAGTSLGSYASGQMYDKQITAAQKVVTADQRAVTQINVEMKIDAKQINDVAKMVAALNALSATAKAKKAAKK